MKQKVKLLIVLAVEFVVIAAILLLIFFAGKKSYTVTFDLNGGTLLSGSTVQRVTQGQSADPPEVTKDGASFRSWSASYRYVTHDIVIKAVWEYATTPGIEYSAPQEGRDRNYCEVIGSYQHLSGAVYIDGLYNEKTVIAIGNGAFKNRDMITSMYLLDGILDIGNEAFSNCTAMQAIEIPSTVLHLGERALENCKSLVTLELPEELYSIGAYAFDGCKSLVEIVLPENLQVIGAYAFDENTVVKVPIAEAEKPSGWHENCFGNAQVVWEFIGDIPVDENGNPIEKDEK